MQSHDFRIAPLHIAAGRGELELIEHLIKHRANVNIEDAFGFVPLDFATDQAVKTLLKSHGAFTTLTPGTHFSVPCR